MEYILKDMGFCLVLKTWTKIKQLISQKLFDKTKKCTIDAIKTA